MNKTEAISAFKKSFERLSYSHDYATTFNSFLDFALFQLAPYENEKMKEDLTRLDKMFDPKMALVICEMFESWSVASDNDGEGFSDVLGDLFMECVSYGRNGQYFTPEPICQMMAELTYGHDLKEGKTVCDPCCGSGRMLMGVAKLQRKMKFYGSDNDHTCVKMCVLNMIVNSMPGEVAWMNSLSMEHYKSYHISVQKFGGYYIPFLKITGKNETSMISTFKESFEEIKKVPEKIKNQKLQLQLF